MNGHLADEEAAGIQRGNNSWKEAPVQVIKQDDQIEACRFKLVFSRIDRKEIDLDVELTGSLTQFPDSNFGHIHSAHLPPSVRQPQRMSS